MLTDFEIINLDPETKERYLAMTPDEQYEFSLKMRKKRKSKDNSFSFDTKSKMRIFGKIGFFVFLLFAIISFFVALDDYRPEMIWTIVWAAFSSGCLSLWVIGTIELRLIEIRDELRNR